MVVENKKISLLGIFSFIFLILFISFIFATTTINNPVANGNYSTTMNFSIETDLPEALNVTVY